MVDIWCTHVYNSWSCLCHESTASQVSTSTPFYVRPVSQFLFLVLGSQNHFLGTHRNYPVVKSRNSNFSPSRISFSSVVLAWKRCDKVFLYLLIFTNCSSRIQEAALIIPSTFSKTKFKTSHISDSTSVLIFEMEKNVWKIVRWAFCYLCFIFYVSIHRGCLTFRWICAQGYCSMDKLECWSKVMLSSIGITLSKATYNFL